MGDSVIQQEGRDSPIVLLRKLHCWRMAFFGLVILLAGMLVGAAVTLVSIRHFTPQRPLPPDAVVERMISQIGPRLRLSPEQRQQITPILRRHINRLEQIRAQGRDQIGEDLKEMNDEMSLVLNPEQQRRWQRYMESLPGQFRRGFGPRPFGPGEGRPAPGRGRSPAPRNPAKVPPPQEVPPPQN
jgi:hypothetical protein